MLQSHSLQANGSPYASSSTGRISLVGFAIEAKKLRITRAFGATATFDVEIRSPRRRIEELTDGRGADADVVHASVFKLDQAEPDFCARERKFSGDESIPSSATCER